MTVQPSIVGLRTFGILAGFAPARLEALAAECTWRRVAAGAQLVRRDAHDRDVHLIVGGRVRVTVVTGSGRQIAYKDLGAGSVVGVLAAIDGAARSTDVLALEEALVATLSAERFGLLLRESREANDWMLKSLVEMVRELSDRVFEVSALGVQNRVHAEVLRLAREAGIAGNRAVIDPAPTHPDIAARVSTYREQVTRELSAMVKAGLLERAGHALVVPDVSRLEAIVAEVRRLA
ncbi:MAG: Crp/Fnr family transcriptional regulator [Burkholderiales bacterium]|nr:Crp/Fnr family transcriptional regulator [Burkholderiales bacterium]